MLHCPPYIYSLLRATSSPACEGSLVCLVSVVGYQRRKESSNLFPSSALPVTEANNAALPPNQDPVHNSVEEHPLTPDEFENYLHRRVCYIRSLFLPPSSPPIRCRYWTFYFPLKKAVCAAACLAPLDLKCRLPGRHCSVEFWFAERGRDLVAVIRRLCVWYQPSLCVPLGPGNFDNRYVSVVSLLITDAFFCGHLGSF